MDTEFSSSRLFRCISLFILMVLIISACSRGSHTAIQITSAQLTQSSTAPVIKIIATLSVTKTTTSKKDLEIESGSNYISSMTGSDPKTVIFKFDWKLYGMSNQHNPVTQPDWLNGHLAQFAVFPSGMDEGVITADISEKKYPKLTMSLVQPDWQIYSPKGTYVIDCRGGIKMVRTSTSEVISDATSVVSRPLRLRCSSFIRWSPDETRCSIIDANNDVYIWQSNGERPQKVQENVASINGNWSPDSSELALVKSVNNRNIGKAVVLDISGTEKNEFEINVWSDGVYLNWLNDQILFSFSRYDRWYYEKRSGQFLFKWTSRPNGDGIAHQNPQVSPDGRWIFIDQGSEIQKNTDQTTKFHVRKDYSLYDLQNKKMISLLSNPNNYLGYAGWDSDSSELYVVNRPTSRSSVNLPNVPFGLLTYNVESQKFNLKFKDAVQIAWNQDRSLAFIVYADRDGQENPGLAGSIWNPTTNARIGHWHLSDNMVYRDPAWDDFFIATIFPIPVLWSHNGESVVVRDRNSQIILIDKNGKDTILVDTTAGIGNASTFRWSPDDQHLLIEDKDSGWIVAIPSD